MTRKQLVLLAVVSGLLVATLFMYFFKDRLDKIPTILIGAALGMVVAEVIIFIGKRNL